jgi:transposase-like protein
MAPEARRAHRSQRQVEIEVPRDRAGTFEPQIVRNRQRWLNGVDEIVLSLYAKGFDDRGDQCALCRDLTAQRAAAVSKGA